MQLKSARRRRQRVSAASDIVMVFEMQQQQQQPQRRRLLRLSHHGRSRSHLSIHDDTATQALRCVSTGVTIMPRYTQR